MTETFCSHDVTVRHEIDVITLRQNVRQVARALGVRLTQQAKITAAISAVARSLIEQDSAAVFTIQINQYTPQPALEIICVLSGTQNSHVKTNLETLLQVDEVRPLVDEASIERNGRAGQYALVLRIWIQN